MAEMSLKVNGMTCNHCKMAVEEALKNLPSVLEADVNLEKGEVRISYTVSDTNKIQFIEAIDEAGFNVV